MRMLSLARLEKVLPHWLQQRELQWIQWGYAFWQFVRANPLALLLLSFFPFYARQLWVKKKPFVVVLGGTISEFSIIAFCTSGLEPPANVVITHNENPEHCSKLKHNGYDYITHEKSIRQLSLSNNKWGEDVIFVERLLSVTPSLAVGKQLSLTEAYEKVMSNRYYLSFEDPKYVVPTWLDYVEYSSKFWGILSTIPIFLQAISYNKCSSFLSLVIIVSDLFRGTLYKLYDTLFNRLTRFVKLNIFKKRTYLYDFFSIFSNRWRYTDTVKKYAYLAKPDEEMTIAWNCKLRSLEDIQILESEILNPPEEGGRYPEDKVFMALYPDSFGYKAECSIMSYGDACSTAVLKEHVYVYVP